MPAVLTLNKVNFSPVVQFHLGVVVFLSGVVFMSKMFNPEPVVEVPLLQLIPNHTLFAPWTLVTSTYLETNVVQFLLAVPGLYFGLDLLTKAWDNANNNKIDRAFFTKNEINKYLLFCAFFTNTITVLNYIVWAIILQDGTVLTAPVNHGLLSIAMSFVVVLKQLKPEVEIRYLSIRYKDLPFLLYVASVVLSVVLKSLTPFFPISNNLLVAWFYLRYIQRDSSSIFEFVTFFPDVVRPALAPVFNGIERVMRSLKLVPGSADDSILPTITVSNEVAERRRAVALKVLEERIGE